MKRVMLSLALLGAGCVCSAGPIELAPEGASVTQAPKPASSPRNTDGTSAKPEAERQAAAPGRPQLADSPEGLMRPGGVLLIQQALAKRGYLHPAPSGALDDLTCAGLRNFQADQKLARTGAPDRETVHRLELKEEQVFK